MLAPNRATNCLTWVMAALALLQSLQGSALACQLGVCHSVSESRSPACCSNRNVPSDSSRETHRDRELKRVAEPSSPCKCPTTCWCRSADLALVEAGEFVPMIDGNELVIGWSPVVDGNSAGPVVSSPIAPKSAQQVCAVLCRFLA
jgi:hypothetical protein